MATKNKDINFELKNEDAIKRLVKDGKVILPKKKVSIPKDRQWNEANFNKALISGLENGNSVRDIAKKLMPEIMSKTDFTGKTQQEIYGKGGIIAKNRESSIRNARTMFTSAENHGRLDSYKNLSDKGVVMKKIWTSTPDDRTRPTHIDIDGEEQDIDAMFSNGCMFPGDGNGPPEEVWMCRCAMGTHIIGFRKADGSVSTVNYNPDSTLHDTQMAEEKHRRSNKLITANDANITNKVLGVNINKEHFEHFSSAFTKAIPSIADRISNGEYPDFDEMFELYGKAKTDEDKLFCKFINDSQSYIQTYQHFDDDTNRQYAEIFSVLNRPSDTVLYRGESGEWVKHYGEFEKGKTISFDSMSFTTPQSDKQGMYDVVFEFTKGTSCINTANQAWDDKLILGQFEIINVKTLDNGQIRVKLSQKGK